MSAHPLAPSTHTVEMLQVIELNDRLATLDPTSGECRLIRAESLGLTGARVYPHVLDRVAAHLLPRQERGDETLTLPGASPLRAILAAGDPSFPYLYAIFGEPDGGRRRLPVLVHTDHLRMISSMLQLPGHRWGV